MEIPSRHGPRKVLIYPLNGDETLFFPRSATRLRELDAMVDECQHNPNVSEVVVLCEADRYLEAINWLRARKDTEVVLRVVRADPEEAFPVADFCVFLSDELGISRTFLDFWTVPIASGPDEPPA